MDTNKHAPIAIGGLGGSGTRVFASALRHMGIRIGARLNEPLDNLWFTVLFKRHAWVDQRPDASELQQAIDLFVRAMTTGLRGQLEPDEAALIARLGADLPPNGHWRCGAKADDAISLVESSDTRSGPWGWKEPNTHLFLSELDAAIDGFRFIHVVRNGLDMAFSSNTWQMRHWAHFYGLASDPDEPLSVRQLRYWIHANQAAIDYGERSMAERFIVIPYEAFCARPSRYVDHLCEFCGFEIAPEWSEEFVRPSSIGRAQDHDLSIFHSDDLEAAAALTRRITKFSSQRLA